MGTELKTIQQVESILDEIDEAFFNIPFENSAFQTEQFVIAAAITPERAYRSIGLRMFNRIRALQEAKYKLIEYQIAIDEADEKITTGELNAFDIRRENLIRLRAKEGKSGSDKLINDALVELSVLYKHFKSLPKFTREQFEAGEQRHFVERLTRQHHLSGDEQSLANMDTDFPALLNFEKSTAELDHIEDAQLEELHKQLPNIEANLPPEKKSCFIK